MIHGPLLRWTVWLPGLTSAKIKFFGTFELLDSHLMIMNLHYPILGDFYVGILWVSRQKYLCSESEWYRHWHERRSKSSTYSCDMLSPRWYLLSIRHLGIAWHRIQSDGHGGKWGNLYLGRIQKTNSKRERICEPPIKVFFFGEDRER